MFWGVFPCHPGAVGDRWAHLRFSLLRDMPCAKLDGTRELRSLPFSWASPEKHDTDLLYARTPTEELHFSHCPESNYPAPYTSAASCPGVSLWSRQVDEAGSSPQPLTSDSHRP